MKEELRHLASSHPQSYVDMVVAAAKRHLSASKRQQLIDRLQELQPRSHVEDPEAMAGYGASISMWDPISRHTIVYEVPGNMTYAAGQRVAKRMARELGLTGNLTYIRRTSTAGKYEEEIYVESEGGSACADPST